MSPLPRIFLDPHYGKQNYCGWCKKEHSTLQELIEHVRVFHSGRFREWIWGRTCPVCKQQFQYTDERWNHFREVHPERYAIYSTNRRSLFRLSRAPRGYPKVEPWEDYRILNQDDQDEI